MKTIQITESISLRISCIESTEVTKRNGSWKVLITTTSGKTYTYPEKTTYSVSDNSEQTEKPIDKEYCQRLAMALHKQVES